MPLEELRLRINAQAGKLDDMAAQLRGRSRYYRVSKDLGRAVATNPSLGDLIQFFEAHPYQAFTGWQVASRNRRADVQAVLQELDQLVVGRVIEKIEYPGGDVYRFIPERVGRKTSQPKPSPAPVRQRPAREAAPASVSPPPVPVQSQSKSIRFVWEGAVFAQGLRGLCGLLECLDGTANLDLTPVDTRVNENPMAYTGRGYLRLLGREISDQAQMMEENEGEITMCPGPGRLSCEDRAYGFDVVLRGKEFRFGFELFPPLDGGIDLEVVRQTAKRYHWRDSAKDKEET